MNGAYDDLCEGSFMQGDHVARDAVDPWDDALRPQMRLDQVVASQSAIRPDHLAIVARDGRRTYRQLEADIDSLAEALRSAGVSPGDRVVTSVSAGLASIAIIYAVSRVRAVVVPVNEFWIKSEIASVIMRSGATYVVTDANTGRAEGQVCNALADLALNERPRHGVLHRTSQIEWGIDHGRDKPTPLSDDLAMLLFTSGSTSRPKGALLTHVGLVGASHYVRVACQMDQETRFLQMLPAYHVGGVVDGFLGVHLAGGTCIAERFDPSKIFQLLIENSVTHVTGFDAMIDSLMSVSGYDPSLHPDWKTVFFSGSEKGYDRLSEVGVSRIVSGFGMTETCADFLITRRSQPEAEIRSSHWIPNPGVETRVVDPVSGQPVRVGEVGELRVRGWNVFPGYLDGTTGRDEHGFFCTGDLFRQTAAGAFRFAGRLKQMIKTGGENVAAAEVEEFLVSEIPGLRNAVVVGVPDERWGEKVVAFAELDPTATLTADEVRDLCRGKLAPFKIPKEVRLVPQGAWPLMAAGKINRAELTKWAADRSQA